jgi:DNA-binding NarL/FixJ family response regulator
VLLWHGDWERAEQELMAAVDELSAVGPGRSVDALARLAELRRRQGRTHEAEEILARATPHRVHPLVEGLLALDGGDAASALEAAARFLRRIGDADRFERVAGLELTVRAAVAAGDLAAAGEAAVALGAIATASPTAALRAVALLAEGRVAAAGGVGVAAAKLEDAADLFDSAGGRYDAAIARLELASVLRVTGRESAATRAETAARDTLNELGARLPHERVGELSAREVEVLQLVARGLSNDEIARKLVLSVRTVERHVANTYAKIGASGRTGRAVATAWAHAHGIA